MSDTLPAAPAALEGPPDGISEVTGEERAVTYRSLDADAVQLTLVYRWFRWQDAWQVVGAVSFCFFWNVLALVAVVGATGGRGSIGVVWVVPALFVVLGSAMLHGLAAHLLNRTTVRVTGRTVQVTHGPVPCGGARRIDRSELVAVSCRRDRRFGGRPGEVSAERPPVDTSYAVVLRLRDGRECGIVSWLSRPGEAQVRYLERRVREQLAMA